MKNINPKIVASFACTIFSTKGKGISRENHNSGCPLNKNYA